MRRGRQTLLFVARVRIGRGDWADAVGRGTRIRSQGWSVQPAQDLQGEQEQMGRQLRRRWRAWGPVLQLPPEFQVEVDDILDTEGKPLRLDVDGVLEVWRHGPVRRHLTQGVLSTVEGQVR